MEDYKTKIILSGLNAGWSVHKTDNDKLEFKKNMEKMTAEEKKLIFKNGFSEKFLQTLIQNVNLVT
jgi:hypothetical protein